MSRLICLLILVLAATEVGAAGRLRRPRPAPVAVELPTAQSVADYMSSIGRIGHFGGNPYPYEGVGLGATKDIAISNCCYWGQRTPAEIGTAQLTNGNWVACVRYH